MKRETGHYKLSLCVASVNEHRAYVLSDSCRGKGSSSRRTALWKLEVLLSAYFDLGVTTKPASAAEGPRQLELCLVSVLRTVYWAQGLTRRIESGLDAGDLELQKQTYLEARLGAKAALTTGKGLGTPPNPTAARYIYMLSTLQLTGCLKDLKTYHNTKLPFVNICQEFLESLASLVEFDGLDTLQDPSPRSSLTLAQWTDKKNRFVQRMLQERVVMLGIAIVASFTEEAQSKSRNYVQRYYPDEVPIDNIDKEPIGTM